ncbi:MAG: hypothetical protein MI861_09715 [Pirellulales bacterium]|nr:hypothetical protein [Pirellulales bacterium]
MVPGLDAENGLEDLSGSIGFLVGAATGISLLLIQFSLTADTFSGEALA